MTRQEVPALLILSGAVLATQRVRVGHITLSDRCRRPVGREKRKSAMSHFWDMHHSMTTIISQPCRQIRSIFMISQPCRQIRSNQRLGLVRSTVEATVGKVNIRFCLDRCKAPARTLRLASWRTESLDWKLVRIRQRSRPILQEMRALRRLSSATPRADTPASWCRRTTATYLFCTARLVEVS